MLHMAVLETVCTAVSPMSGSPTFDAQKKTERGEFTTPPRATGRRSKNEYLVPAFVWQLYISVHVNLETQTC